MKTTALLFASLFVMTTAFAQTRQVAEELFKAAFKAQDNVVYHSADEMESKLLQALKANPERFGMNSKSVKNLQRLDDIQDQRLLSEVLSEVSNVLRLDARMSKAAMEAVAGHPGVAAQLKLKMNTARNITLASGEQSGLGRTLSLRIKQLDQSLVAKNLATPEDAQRIKNELFEASLEISKKASGDLERLSLARQIVNYSAAITEKTGKEIIGKGCGKIGGKSVLTAQAEIIFRTLNEVETQGLKSYDEISEVLQKNFAAVTNRNKAEACKALKALTVGGSCGGVFSAKLAPTNC